MKSLGGHIDLPGRWKQNRFYAWTGGGWGSEQENQMGSRRDTQRKRTWGEIAGIEGHLGDDMETLVQYKTYEGDPNEV